MRVAVAVFLSLSTVAFRQTLPILPADKLVITNVNVVDTRQGQTARHVTVVIRRGRIVTVAKVGLLDATRSYQIINAGGEYLIPGDVAYAVADRYSSLGSSPACCACGLGMIVLSWLLLPCSGVAAARSLFSGKAL